MEWIENLKSKSALLCECELTFLLGFSLIERERERAQRYGIKGDNMMWIKYTLWYSLANFTLWLWKAKQSPRWIERWKQHTQKRGWGKKNGEMRRYQAGGHYLSHFWIMMMIMLMIVQRPFAVAELLNRKRKSLRYLGGVTETLAALSRQSASVSYCYRKWLLRVKMNERWHCCANRSKQPLNHEFCLHVFTFTWTE